MRILPQIRTTEPTIPLSVVSPDPAPPSPEIDQELRLLKERVQALESQPKPPAAVEAPDMTLLLTPLKTDVQTQAQAMSAMQKTLESIEGRLHSCEEAPRLFAITFMKEVEEHVQSGVSALEKKITERFESLPATLPTPPAVEKIIPAPAPIVVNAPVVVALPNWETRFESHEKVLAELMKEISVVSKQLPPPVVPTLIVSEALTPIEIPKPFETSAPDRAAEHSLDIAWTPGELPNQPHPRSLATRLWYYLNAPAFGTSSDVAKEPPHK